MAAMQLKGLMLIVLLAGHEAVRIHDAAGAVNGVQRRSGARSSTDPEEAFQALNQECQLRISGCTGDGCAWRRLSHDWPPPSSQSCRHTDEHMIANNGPANLQMAAGLLHAKSVKYANKCKGATIFNRYCARRQQQMVRAMKFIAKAEVHPEVVNGLTPTEREEQKELFDASLNNVAGTMGEDGPLVMDFAEKMKLDPATKKDPRAAVQNIMQLLWQLSFGSEDEKNQAREDIRKFEPSAELSAEEAQEVDQKNALLASQLTPELSSEADAVSQVLDKVDKMSPDELGEDDDEGGLSSSLELASNNASASMLQVRSGSKVVAANIIGFTLLAILVAIVVIFAVLEVIAVIVTWAVLAALGCGSYAAGHDAAIAKSEGHAMKQKKKGVTGFGTCFLKIFAFPFIVIGTASVATYNYFFGKKEVRGGSLLQVAANSTSGNFPSGDNKSASDNA